MEGIMKTIALLTALISTSAIADSEQVMRKVDAFLAKDTYAAALKCGDKAVHGMSAEKSEEFQTLEVTKCGAETEITISLGEDSFTVEFDAVGYNALRGNPLRLYTLGEGVAKKRLTDTFEWLSATPEVVTYLGKKRNALLVKGRGEICIEEDNGAESCEMGAVHARVVQGVPLLARIPMMSFQLPQFEMTLKQEIIKFSRK